MKVPGPFDPVSLAAAVFANFATDVLKHHAKRLEGTKVGGVLKSAGLIDPNFYDRLRSALSEGLELYFQTHPRYQLTGIVAFFRDPDVTKQIANYILERKPINQSQISEVLKVYLEVDKLTNALIRKRGLDPESILPDFLQCFRQVLIKQLSLPQIALFLEILEQTDTVLEEIRASEERLKAFIEQITDDQAVLSKYISAEQLSIKQHLGLDRPKPSIIKEIQLSLDSAIRGTLFDGGGICSGYPLNPMPNRYFVAQEFNTSRDDLRNALTKALQEFGTEPICADDIYWPGHRLCKISSLIQSTPFGVYQLAVSQDRNVHLELGIALGLGRPFVLVKDKDAAISPILQGVDYYAISSYLELRYELGQKLADFIANIARHSPLALPTADSRNTVVISHDGSDVIDFCISAAKAIARFGLMPIILGDPTGKLPDFLKLEKVPYQIINIAGKLQISEVMTATEQARLGIYRIDEKASADALTVLGASIGLNRKGILVHRKENQVPSDLRGLSALEFHSYSELEDQLADQIRSILED